MRDPTCPTCGARAGRGLPRCPSCGASLDLEVQPVGPDPDDRATEVVLGRPTSRWWAAGAVVGVIALLAAGSVATGGRSRRAADVTTTTSSTSSSTTSPHPSTSQVPRRTSTVPDRPRSAQVAVADVLDPQRATGIVLYALSSNQDLLWRVDLLTGDATIRRIDGPDGFRDGDGVQLSLLARTGGVVVSDGGYGAIFVPGDPDAPIVALGGDRVLPHADPTRVWRVTDGPEEARMEPIDLAGNVAGEAYVLSHAAYFVGDDGTGRALVAFGGGTYSVADGIVRKVASSSILAVGAARIVVLECAEDALRCDAVTRLTTDGTEVGRVPMSEAVMDGGWAGTFSPSGSALALFDADRSEVVVHRLDGTGSWQFPFVADPLYAFGGPLAPVAWADEQTLCGLVKDVALRCWRDGDNPGADVVTLEGTYFHAMALGDS